MGTERRVAEVASGGVIEVDGAREGALLALQAVKAAMKAAAMKAATAELKAAGVAIAAQAKCR